MVEAMFKNGPRVEQVIFGEKLDGYNKKQNEKDKPSINIFKILTDHENETDTKTIAIIGCAGSGKSVYTSMIIKFFTDLKKWPFLVKVPDIVDDSVLISFPDFLRNYSLMDLPIYKTSEAEELLRDNEERCVFVLDGLDQSCLNPFPFGCKIQPIIEGKTTACSWFSFLFQKKKMESSKLVFTCRDASLLKLAPSLRPDLIFRLKGLSEEAMRFVISIHNDGKDADDIMNFIKSKGNSFASFCSSPLVLSILTTHYKTKNKMTMAGYSLTKLYELIMDKFQDSEHVIETSTSVEELDRKIQQLYFDLLRDRLSRFSSDKLASYGLNLKQVEQITMVNVESRKRHRITAKDIWITPAHPSLLEVYAAQYIMNDQRWDSFEAVVNEKLFCPDDEQQWTMVRRFVCGFIENSQVYNGGNGTQEKRELFLEKHANQLQAILSKDYFDSAYGDERSNLEQLQSGLCMDLIEMPIASVTTKSKIHSTPKLWLEIRPKKSIQLQGTINLLKEVDPEFEFFEIFLPSDLDVKSFYRLTTSLRKLKRKPDWISIMNINLPLSHVDELQPLLNSFYQDLYLAYNKETTDEQFDHIQTKVLNLVERNKNVVKETLVDKKKRKIVMTCRK